jgi:hypothetical protein
VTFVALTPGRAIIARLRDEALSQKIDIGFDLLVVKIDALEASLNLDRRLDAVEKKVA